MSHKPDPLSIPLTELPPHAVIGVTLEHLEQLRYEAYLASVRFKSFIANPNHRAKDFTQHRQRLAENAMVSLNRYKEHMSYAHYN